MNPPGGKLKQFFWGCLEEWESWKRGMLLHLPGKLGVKLRYRFYRRRFASCGRGVVIFQNVRFECPEKLHVGDQVEIGSGSVISAGGIIRIGSHVGMGPGVGLWSVNHVFSDPDRPFLEQGYEYGEITIGDDVWLGSGAIVKAGVRIGRGAIVSGGAVLAKSLPPFSIAGGNPARIVGWRKAPPVDEAPRDPS